MLAKSSDKHCGHVKSPKPRLINSIAQPGNVQHTILVYVVMSSTLPTCRRLFRSEPLTHQHQIMVLNGPAGPNSTRVPCSSALHSRVLLFSLDPHERVESSDQANRPYHTQAKTYEYNIQNIFKHITEHEQRTQRRTEQERCLMLRCRDTSSKRCDRQMNVSLYWPVTCHLKDLVIITNIKNVYHQYALRNLNIIYQYHSTL